MIDLYNYIGSNSIKKHLKSLDYEFDIIDAARLIYRAPLELNKRINLIEELLISYNEDEYNEKKKAIQYMIDCKKEQIKFFNDKKETFVYRFNITWNKPEMLIENIEPDYRDYEYHCPIIYSTYEKCIDAVKEVIKPDNMLIKDKKPVNIEISIWRFDEPQVGEIDLYEDLSIKNVYIGVEETFNPDLELPEEEFSIDCPPNLPIPFKDGDLVKSIDSDDFIGIIRKRMADVYNDDEAYNYCVECMRDDEILMLYFDPEQDEWTGDWLNYEHYNSDECKKDEFLEKIKNKKNFQKSIADNKYKKYN